MATKKSSKRASAKKSPKTTKVEHVSEKAPVEEVAIVDTTEPEETEAKTTEVEEKAEVKTA